MHISPSASSQPAPLLTSRESSALIASFAGWMLDGMDAMIYSFLLPSLMLLWHLTAAQAGNLATATLIVSAIGGWLAGVLADRFGRVPVLQCTIVWFAIFTFLCGFTNNYSQLLIFRSLQGLGFGGEWAVGAALISETIRPQLRGRAVGIVQSGWAIGWAIAAGLHGLLFTVLPEAYAWRALFCFGLLPALAVFYIRRHVAEPASSQRASSIFESMGGIFDRRLLGTTALAGLVATGAQGGYYALNTWLPLYLRQERGLALLSGTGHIAVVIAGSFTGYLTAAYITDRLGRRPALLLFAAGALATVWFYMLPSAGGPILSLLLGFPLGFFPSGSFSPMGSFFAELFPSAVRGSGQAFTYNFGRGVGALFPAMVGHLSSRHSLGQSITWFSAGAYVIMFTGVLLLPETKGRALS